MDEVGKPKLYSAMTHYDANYGNFQTELYAQIRREAFGEDIGQNSWLTAGEQDDFVGWLGLSPGKTLLDVDSGAGGPALRIAAITGCSVVGIDVHAQAVSTANAVASQRGLSHLAEFQVSNATEPLPFADGSFDAVTCLDAINHLPNRRGLIENWARVLKIGGRLLFTDPATVTGSLTSVEIAIRSSKGFFLFVPPDYDELVIGQCGLRLLVRKDVTANMSEVAERRGAARQSRNTALVEIEGETAYEGEQRFLAVSALVAREGRLSRFLYVAEKGR
jgi:2-polyprenyl-3-methyl-5-hydroxy-6-metoxy-1,4-benzoquinol methylase